MGEGGVDAVVWEVAAKIDGAAEGEDVCDLY